MCRKTNFTFPISDFVKDKSKCAINCKSATGKFKAFFASSHTQSAFDWGATSSPVKHAKYSKIKKKNFLWKSHVKNMQRFGREAPANCFVPKAKQKVASNVPACPHPRIVAPEVWNQKQTLTNNNNNWNLNKLLWIVFNHRNSHNTRNTNGSHASVEECSLVRRQIGTQTSRSCVYFQSCFDFDLRIQIQCVFFIVDMRRYILQKQIMHEWNVSRDLK